MKIIELEKIGMQACISESVEVLRQGGIVVHPTDTCYGLACDVTNEEAVEKLYMVKRMPANKPVSVFVDSMEMAKRFGVIDVLSEDLVAEYWPGPLTVVLPRNDALPLFFNLNVESIGMRWPKNDLCIGLVQGLGGPVSTTSANLSGKLEVYDVSDFIVQLNEERGVVGDIIEPDLIVDAGVRPKVKPSTIVAIGDGGRFEVIRQGDLKIS